MVLSAVKQIVVNGDGAYLNHINITSKTKKFLTQLNWLGAL